MVREHTWITWFLLSARLIVVNFHLFELSCKNFSLLCRIHFFRETIFVCRIHSSENVLLCRNYNEVVGGEDPVNSATSGWVKMSGSSNGLLCVEGHVHLWQIPSQPLSYMCSDLFSYCFLVRLTNASQTKLMLNMHIYVRWFHLSLLYLQFDIHCQFVVSKLK